MKKITLFLLIFINFLIYSNINYTDKNYTNQIKDILKETDKIIIYSDNQIVKIITDKKEKSKIINFFPLNNNEFYDKEDIFDHIVYYGYYLEFDLFNKEKKLFNKRIIFNFWFRFAVISYKNIQLITRPSVTGKFYIKRMYMKFLKENKKPAPK